MAVPTYIVGRNWTLTITPMSIDAQGNLTAQYSNTFVGVTEHVEFSQELELIDATAIDQYVHNNLPIGESFSVSIREMVAYNGSIIAQGLDAAEYFYITATYSTGGGFKCTVVESNFKYNVERGVTIAELEGKCVGLAATFG